MQNVNYNRNTTYSIVLKQPDKHKMAIRKGTCAQGYTGTELSNSQVHVITLSLAHDMSALISR
jgi:hypothetical protein